MLKRRVGSFWSTLCLKEIKKLWSNRGLKTSCSHLDASLYNVKKTAQAAKKNLTDIKYYPNVCSAWTTCDQLLVHDLIRIILSEFPRSTTKSVNIDVDEKIICVENLIIEETESSVSGTLLAPRLFLFDYGCLVFWNVDKNIERKVRKLAVDGNFEIGPYDPSIVLQENDCMPFVLDSTRSRPGITKDLIQFPTGLSDKDVILYQFAYSNSLALSVKLAYWEIAVDSLVRSLSPFIDQMKSGSLFVEQDQIMKIYGKLFQIDYKINLSNDFVDVPEIYWDQSALEEAFLAMRTYLGVKERIRIIGVKIAQSFNLLEMLRSHLNETRSHYLEQLIILLISVEILVTLISPESILEIVRLILNSLKSADAEEFQFISKLLD